MMTIRKADERGHADHGWLDTWHTFSFAEYYDPRHMGFRALRVINDDVIGPGQGFGTHPHQDMEILTYVLEGALEHRDSMGNGSVLHAGDMQRMSAGKGIMHSESNASDAHPVRLLQIWILPEQNGIQPGYEDRRQVASEGTLTLVAAPGEPGDASDIHQDVRVYVGRLPAGQEAELDVAEGRHAWVQVASGQVWLNGQELKQGDGAALSEESLLEFKAAGNCEFLVFDLA